MELVTGSDVQRLWGNVSESWFAGMDVDRLNGIVSSIQSPAAYAVALPWEQQVVV